MDLFLLFKNLINSITSLAVSRSSPVEGSPNEILTADDEDSVVLEEEIIKRLSLCTRSEKETALRLLNVYLDSLK